MSKKYLVDTNILIAFYNSGKHADNLFALNKTSQLFFSAVSINEFVRGAHDAVSKSIIADFLNIAKNNLITPSLSNWLDCGRISETLLKKERRSKINIVLLQNDILIALTAKEYQQTLITADTKDFKLISQFVDFKAEYW